MRIVLLSSELPPGPGGIGTHAHQVAKQLTARGAEVTVVAPQDYADEVEVSAWTREQPFRVERLRHVPGSSVQAVTWSLRIFAAIRSHPPDVIVASGLRFVGLGAMLAGLVRRPLVAIGHGLEFGVGGWKRQLARWSFARAAAVVCVSEYTKRRMLDAGIEARRVEVIPNGADDETFGVARGTPPRRSPSRRLLVTVGTVSRRKGQDLVIRALPRIVAAGFDVAYVAVGLAPTADLLRSLTEDEGVADRVELPGRLATDEVVGLLGAADLFVLPSRHTDEGDFEGFGIAVVEAALCATPAVVTSDSGLVEAIVDGETGLAVPPEDPEALARAILELLRDDSRRVAMGRRARERAVAEQTWERRGEHYDRLLREIASVS